MRLVPLFLLAFPAVAAAAPLPASQHSPPIVLDETEVSLRLYGSSDGYKIDSHFEMTGFSSKTDTARLDWISKGKVIVSIKCKFDIEDGFANGGCDLDDKTLKVTGPIEAKLIYWDDQEEKEYLVRTLKVTVHHWKGKWETWQIAPDEALSTAWMYMGDEETANSYYRLPTLYLWFTSGDQLPNPVLRCKVGDKKLADIKLSESDGGDINIVADTNPIKGEPVQYHWTQRRFRLEVYWGQRSSLRRDMPKNTKADGVMSDNPGTWECGFRHEGKTIRTITFTVDADGMIQQDEIQSGKNAIPTVSPKVVLVDVRLTKDSASFDKRINPAAMKKSLAYGLPWPDHPKVKAIHASYPAKSGLADPPK